MHLPLELCPETRCSRDLLAGEKGARCPPKESFPHSRPSASNFSPLGPRNAPPRQLLGYAAELCKCHSCCLTTPAVWSIIININVLLDIHVQFKQMQKKLTLIRYLWGWRRQLTDELEVSRQQTSIVTNSTHCFFCIITKYLHFQKNSLY